MSVNEHRPPPADKKFESVRTWEAVDCLLVLQSGTIAWALGNVSPSSAHPLSLLPFPTHTHPPPPQLEYTDEHSRTFVFGDEDHTLGNSLRHVLMGRKETTFCGYSVPHPSEPKMNVRLQTSTSKPAVQVLKDGLHEIVEICDLFDFTLDSAIAEYEAREKDAGAEGGQSDSN